MGIDWSPDFESAPTEVRAITYPAAEGEWHLYASPNRLPIDGVRADYQVRYVKADYLQSVEDLLRDLAAESCEQPDHPLSGSDDCCYPCGASNLVRKTRSSTDLPSTKGTP